MGLDALIAELTRVAEADIAQIRTEATDRANTARAAGDAAARRRQDSELALLEAKSHEAVARGTTEVQRECRRAALEARDRLVAEILDRARAQLASADASRYRHAVPALVATALAYLEGHPAILECRPDVAGEVRASCAHCGSVEVQVIAEADAGVLARSSDARVTVDNRLHALLRRRTPDLRIELVRRMEAS